MIYIYFVKKKPERWYDQWLSETLDTQQGNMRFVIFPLELFGTGKCSGWQ